MWGNPERALRLDDSDALSMLLFQVASPAHVPLSDSRWQELLHGYDVWVHVEYRDAKDDVCVVHQACQSMAKHAATSSNLAALAIHVSRMLQELHNKNNSIGQVDRVAEFSNRIALVGKARAAAGALQLMRIFLHRVLVQYASQPSVLQDVFTYRNRDSRTLNKDAGMELLTALFYFVSSDATPSAITALPELYDCTVLVMQLLLVMLSTQLYRPMISSFQLQQQLADGDGGPVEHDFFLDKIMRVADQMHTKEEEMMHNGRGNKNNDNIQTSKSRAFSWTPNSFLTACLNYQIQRPKAPDRSIAHYHAVLASSVAVAKGERIGLDGMYETHLVVTAAAPKPSSRNSLDGNSGMDHSSSSNHKIVPHHQHHAHHHGSQHFLLDATKGVLVQASTIILLPFRLVSLALGLWANKQHGFDQSRKSHLTQTSSRTKDVLWMSDSPVSDMASCLLLLLTNNRRAATLESGQQPASNKAGDDDKNTTTNEGNSFRRELALLVDNRWDSGREESALPDLPDPLSEEALSMDQSEHFLDSPQRSSLSKHSMTLNFETLFLSFGSILHTEVGALLLYTILQSSPAFSESMAVRSDLDTLILPLLRTLYFSSSSRHVASQNLHSRVYHHRAPPKRQGSERSLATMKSTMTVAPGGPLSIRNCPFRSQSQLYVIAILLLLFSQDTSFGSDAFRRCTVSTVPWYKERYLKDVNLGSMLLLTLLRSLTFNLNRLHDQFLLSNCCAVLMNLSHAVVDLHEYAAMRIASVTVSCLKKYAELVLEDRADKKANKKGAPDVGVDTVSLLEMYSEVSHTLLSLIKQAISTKNIDRNLHLVYACVYHQADLKKVFSMKHSPFKKSEISRIHNVVITSGKIIEKQSNARTATKCLQILTENMDEIRNVVAEKKKKVEAEDFTFTYEEEADPEIFFVPYVWEVAVCTVTASSIEWDKNRIQAFPLLEEEEQTVDETTTHGNNSDLEVPLLGADGVAPAPHVFSKDVMDVV